MRAWNFWRKRTVDEFAAEQGIAVPQQLDEMIGAAAELWNDDRDFDRFVQAIQDAKLEASRRSTLRWPMYTLATCATIPVTLL